MTLARRNAIVARDGADALARDALPPEEARAIWKRLDDECAARGVRWDGRMMVAMERGR